MTNFPPKFNVILLGPVGTGKTSALATIPPHSKLLCISTEPGIANILTHDDHDCHWTYIPPATTPWDILQKNANDINRLAQSELQKSTGNRREYRQFIDLLSACAGFKCDICGKEYGPIDNLPLGYVVAIDGLSGISTMAMDIVVGGKPIKTMADWGTAMDTLERFITKCCADTKCSFVLTAHIDREVDEITGGTKIMVSTLGRRLAPRIPRFFDEVVLCTKRGNQFFWNTIEPGVDLKARRLPFGEEIPPDFGPLLASPAGHDQ